MLEPTLRNLKSHERTFLLVAALVVGVVGGLGACGFRWLIHAIERVGWGTWNNDVANILAQPTWVMFLVPAVGGLIVGPLVYFFAREAKGHGVPEVMEAVALRSGKIRPRLVIVKSIASALSIGCGGSVGREGPIVQIGSALGSTIGQLLKVSGGRLRTLVGCGAAAGIAATFNAPIAGAIFAVEVILADFAVASFSPIVISSVIATVVARHFLGDVPAFTVPSYGMESPLELPVYFALGIAAALVATLFVRLLYRLEDAADRLPGPAWIWTPIGGLLLGVIGLKYPHVLGVGYDTIESALRGEALLGLLAALILMKILATSVTIAAGFSGGVFAPSLFIGAATGGTVGLIAHGAFPEVCVSPGAYALVGMGAVVAGTTRAPITAILIIFELTGDYELILPLMSSCIVATLLCDKLGKESIYTMKLIRRGVDLQAGKELNVLRSLRVRGEMSDRSETVSPNTTFGRLLARFNETPSSYYYVVRDDGRLEGVVSLAELSAHIPDAPVLQNLLVASEMARDDVPAVAIDANLDDVTRMFDGRSREELPVVDERGRFAGVIGRRQIVEAYNRELMKRDMVHGLGSSLRVARAGEPVSLGGEQQLLEVEAPASLIDRSLGQLDVRQKHGVQVLLVKRPAGDQTLEIAPDRDTILRHGDRLVCMGHADALRRLKIL